jgi:transposase
MPRFKAIDYSPRFLAVDLSRQLIPGSFECALHHLLDHEIDLAEIEARYRNDEVGASAYEPRVLLKIVLLAYARGIISSRSIEAACRSNVQFIALSGDSQPHYSTLASFISKLGDAAAKIFTQVLMICARQGLIGREMFAIDGVKLPSSASKAKSGTRADFLRQAAKMEQAVGKLIARHREQDAQKSTEEQDSEKHKRRIEKLQREAKQIRQWLEANPEDRTGSKGAVRLSNRTDNESAKMATGKGVIQGYTGVAGVDEKHQIIVAAQAHGTGSEQELLTPVVDALKTMRADNIVITADSGYHSKANLEKLEADQIEAFIPDNDYRKRDERYADQARHQDKPDPLWNKRAKEDQPKRFGPQDFKVADDFSHCICPAGKQLYRNGGNCNVGGYKAIKFTGAKRDCRDCRLRSQCLRNPNQTIVRQVAIFVGKHDSAKESALDRMKRKIDSDTGRQMIGRRFATVEPVFGNLRHNKRLNRFTLRGRQKVDGQWKLYCLVHNIEKLTHNGYAR